MIIILSFLMVVYDMVGGVSRIVEKTRVRKYYRQRIWWPQLLNTMCNIEGLADYAEIS